MIIDYTCSNIIKIDLIHHIGATFKNIDTNTNIVQLSFDKLDMDNIIIFDTTCNSQIKHYQNCFYINRSNEYIIKIDGIVMYSIKPIKQQELLKII